jgi:hypothetical protein
MRAADGSGGTAKTFLARLTRRARAEHQRNWPLIAARGRRRPCHRAAQWLTETELLAALARAWLVSTIAVSLLCGALALATIWDRTIFFEALHEALTTNPELLQPPEDVPGSAPADRLRQSSISSPSSPTRCSFLR